MSRCLRYQNPTICRYLATQYVAGCITARVRARIETLIKTTPELEREISRCADNFSPIYNCLPEQLLTGDKSDQLWKAIDEQTEIVAANNEHHSWWDTLLIWKTFSGIGAGVSFVLACVLWLGLGDLSTQTAGPSYLANMSAYDDPQKTVQFVVSAYAKNNDDPSRLHVQWTKEHAGSHKEALHLWTEDRDTGKLVYIGLQPKKGQPWDLTKTTWKAVANSRRLLMTSNNQLPTDTNTLFSGLCLQLKAWKKKA